MQMPIDIRLTTVGGTQNYVISNAAAGTQWYLLPAAGNVTAVSLDPDTWILRGDAALASYLEGPPKLLAAAPGPGQIATPLASQVSLQFSQPITFQPAYFHLSHPVAGEVPVTVQYNASVYAITLTASAPLRSRRLDGHD